jgi:CheY-like chemotaxis protein
MMLLKDKYIFCVEDNPQNRVIFQMSLIRHGALVEFERWGEGALRRLQSVYRVDAIILDLMLANGASGFDIFQQIKQTPRFENTPIVAVSAMDPSIAMPKTSAMGFAGFISKPINNAVFPRQIASIVAGEHVWYAGERA